MKKKRSKLQRIDEGFLKEGNKIMKMRAQKGLANPLRREEVSVREFTDLVRKTDSWPVLLNELKWKKKPRKKKR